MEIKYSYFTYYQTEKKHKFYDTGCSRNLTKIRYDWNE